MRIIVAGSRNATEAQVNDALARCPWIGFASAIVSGTARGADEFGERWAAQHQLRVHQFPADWGTHGKRAGPIRNRQMAQNAEGLVAVWDGRSRGTRTMIEFARQNGLRILIFRTDIAQAEDIAPSGELEDIWGGAEERAAIFEFCGELNRKEAERHAGMRAAEQADARRNEHNVEPREQAVAVGR